MWICVASPVYTSDKVRSRWKEEQTDRRTQGGQAGTRATLLDEENHALTNPLCDSIVLKKHTKTQPTVQIIIMPS